MKRTQLVVACLCALFALISPNTYAQSEASRCEKLLTLNTLNAEAGAGFKAEFAYDRDPGEIECGWVRLEAGGGKTQIILLHRSKAAIASQAKNYQNGRTPEEMWEVDVSDTERSQNSKRLLIPGLGKRAALIPLPKLRLGIRAFILRDNDAIMMTTTGLSNDDFIKVAKVIAAP